MPNMVRNNRGKFLFVLLLGNIVGSVGKVNVTELRALLAQRRKLNDTSCLHDAADNGEDNGQDNLGCSDSASLAPTRSENPSQSPSQRLPREISTQLNQPLDILPADPAFVVVRVVVDPLNGRLVIKEDKTTLTYTPKEEFRGLDSFTVEYCTTLPQCSVAKYIVSVGKDASANKDEGALVALYALCSLLLVPFIAIAIWTYKKSNNHKEKATPQAKQPPNEEDCVGAHIISQRGRLIRQQTAEDPSGAVDVCPVSTTPPVTEAAAVVLPEFKDQCRTVMAPTASSQRFT